MCDVCTSDTTFARTLGDLVLRTPPRWGPAGQVETCIAEYDIFEEDGSLAVDALTDDPMASEGLPAWASGVASYAGITIVIALVTLIWGLWLLVTRYCCCCCDSPRCCATCFQCGGRQPRAATNSCCPCGYKFVPDPKLGGSRGSYSYSGSTRLAAGACFGLYIALAAGILAMGELLGNQALTTAQMDAIIEAPVGVATMVHSHATTSLPTLVIDVADGMRQTILELNTTVQTYVSFDSLIADVECAKNSIGGLPNVTDLRSYIGQLDSDLDTMKTNIADLGSSIATVDAQVAAVGANASAVTALLDQYESASQTVDGLLDTLSLQLTEVHTNASSVVAPGGLADTVLQGFTDVEAAGPNSTVASQAETALGDLLTPGTGFANLPAADRTSLVRRLGTLENALAAFPNTNTLADDVEGFNTFVSDIKASGIIDELNSTLTDTLDAVDGLPAGTDINSTAQALLDAVNSVDLDPIIAQLEALNVTITSLVDFDFLRGQIDQIRDIQNILPCLRSMEDQVDAVNASLIQLPSSLNDITNITDPTNSTLRSAIDQIDPLEGDIDSAEADIDAIDMDQYINDTRRQADDVADARGDFDLAGVLDDILQANTDSALDVSSIFGDLESFNSSLSSASVDASIITSLRTAWTTVQDMQTRVAVLRSDIEAHFESLAIGDAPICVLQSNGSAGTGTCNFDDSECPGGTERCSVDTVRATTLQTLANNWQIPDVSAAKAEVTTLQSDSTSTLTSITSVQDDLASAQSSIDSLGTDDFRDQLTDLEDSTSTFDTADVQTTIDDAKDAIDAVDISDADEQLDSLEDEMDTLTDLEDTLEDLIDGLDAVQRLFNVHLHTHLPRISVTSLTNIKDEQGIRMMIRELADFADDVVYDLRYDSTMISDSLDQTTIASEVDASSLDRIDVLDSGDFEAYGAAYFLARLGYGSDSDQLVPAAAVQSGASVWTNPEGEEWNDDAMCLTDSCIRSEVENAHTAPLSENKQLDGTLPNGLPGDAYLTRENIYRALLIIPALMVLLALLGLCLPFTCAKCKCRPQRQQCAPSCFAACGFIFTPILLLLVTPPLLFTIIGNDVCASVPGVALQWVDKNPDLCTDLGGTGTNTACSINVSLGGVGNDGAFEEVTTTLNLRAVLDGVLTGVDAGLQDPLAPLYTDFATSIRTDTTTYTDELNDKDLGDGLRLRPAMQAVLSSAGSRWAEAVASHVEGLGDIYSTNALHETYMDFHGLMCCETMSAGTAMVLALFLFGLLTACVGIPAALCARKRIVSEPWGKFFMRDQEEHALATADERDGALIEDESEETRGAASPGVHVVRPAPSDRRIGASKRKIVKGKKNTKRDPRRDTFDFTDMRAAKEAASFQYESPVAPKGRAMAVPAPSAPPPAYKEDAGVKARTLGGSKGSVAASFTPGSHPQRTKYKTASSEGVFATSRGGGSKRSNIVTGTKETGRRLSTGKGGPARRDRAASGGGPVRRRKK